MKIENLIREWNEMASDFSWPEDDFDSLVIAAEGGDQVAMLALCDLAEGNSMPLPIAGNARSVETHREKKTAALADLITRTRALVGGIR